VCLVNAQMIWLLYKLTVYLLSLHGTIVFCEFLSVVGVSALNPFSFSAKIMSVAQLIDQRKIIFSQKNSQSESSVLKALAYLKRNMCNVLRSEYGLCS